MHTRIPINALFRQRLLQTCLYVSLCRILFQMRYPVRVNCSDRQMNC